MKTITLRIRKNSCRTPAFRLNGCRELQMLPFRSGLRELAIVLEDKGSRSVYYAASTHRTFRKLDPLEFQKVWLEYQRADREYEVEVRVS